MKTLTKNNLSLYSFEDNVSVVMTTKGITVGDPAQFIIRDCNSNDTVLHENVVDPDDWYGHKYTYDGTTWALVAGWVDPRV
tara:strand:- start:1356 stop:1598 length:243 start_codon:yes stop_codon:yes gene_type:complete